MNRRITNIDENEIKKGNEKEDLAKKIENKKDLHLRRFSHLYSPLSSAESSFVENKNTRINGDYKSQVVNQNTVKKEIILKNSPKKSSILNDNSFSGDSSTESRQQKNDFFNNENATSQNDKSYEAQNQLKFYIQSLEKKLANLRTEMKDSTVLNQSNQNSSSKKPDRFLNKDSVLKTYASNESIDSIKDIANVNDAKQIYSNTGEFNLKDYFDKKDLMNFNTQDQKFMTPNLSPASTFAESSEEINGSPDSAALKKSLHKSNGADNLFDRVKAVSATLAHSSSFTNHQNKSNSQVTKFTPILNDKIEDSNSRSETSLSNKDDNFCIKNPIPIRYSSTTTATTTTGTSSSADSMSHYIKMDKFESVENLEFKRSSIDEAGKCRNLGDSIVPTIHSLRSGNVETFNRQNDFISKGLNMFKDTASSFRRANTFNSNQVSPHFVQKTKSLLIVAHENQLSDITETCKEEMGLLMSFKDSQMVK